MQEYVKHPLLYRGRKFDLRVWAVITSIDPLRIYLLNHAFPKVLLILPLPLSKNAKTQNRDPAHPPALALAAPAQVSTVPYSSDASIVGRHCLSSPSCACMHVRMPMGEGCDINQLVRPYPPHTDTSLFKRGLRFGPSFAGRGARASDE